MVTVKPKILRRKPLLSPQSVNIRTNVLYIQIHIPMPDYRRYTLGGAYTEIKSIQYNKKNIYSTVNLTWVLVRTIWTIWIYRGGAYSIWWKRHVNCFPSRTTPSHRPPSSKCSSDLQSYKGIIKLTSVIFALFILVNCIDESQWREQN